MAFHSRDVGCCLSWASFLAHHLDSACQQVGVYNAIICLQQRVYTDFDCSDGTVRVMFSGFSCAFNTIKSSLYGEMLRVRWVDVTS